MNTKSGSRMAFLTLDDKTARIEIGVYGELYDQRRDVIHKDKVLVVKGKASIDHFSGRIRLSADELFDIEQARSQMARHMQIQLLSNQVNSQMLTQLKSILAPSDLGLCSIGFEYLSDDGVCQLDLDQSRQVVPNKIMLDQLDELIGQSQVRLIY